MRIAYQRYSGAQGYSSEQFRAVASEVAGVDLSAFFHDVLDTTRELDYQPMLDWFGLRFRAPGQRNGALMRVNTGLRTRSDNGRLVVSAVLSGTPGEAAGFNAGDEIVAVDGYRLRADQWPARLGLYKRGEVVHVTIAHRDHMEERALTVTEDQPASWQLEVRPDATGAQQAHLRSWLRQ
jgi:predicted metalloprotease with PDZ domain